MRPTSKKLLGAAGIAAASAAAAVLSTYAVTGYFLRAAMDRELPKSIRRAEKLISGTKSENIYMEAVAEAEARLAARENEIVELTARDGEKLIGHWIPQENPRRIIVAMHGWRSCWSRDFSLAADFWADHGCSVLYAEQRGQNNSGGDYMGFGLTERYDCLDWVRWVTERCGDTLPVYLCGISMGATTVLMAAGLELPKNVHGVMADCGFTSPRAIWQHVARDNLHLPFQLRSTLADAILKRKIQAESSAYSTVDALKHCTVPVLFIHGAEDHFVPVGMTYENYAACPGPKRLFIVPGADHGLSLCVDPEGYTAAVEAFWRDYD